jgi:hypothetical protein
LAFDLAVPLPRLWQRSRIPLATPYLDRTVYSSAVSAQAGALPRMFSAGLPADFHSSA